MKSVEYGSGGAIFGFARDLDKVRHYEKWFQAEHIGILHDFRFLNYLAGKGGDSSFVKRLDEAVDKAKNKEEWRMEYMTLLMRDREKIEEGAQRERIKMMQRMIRKGCTKDFILELGCTEAEYAEAEAELFQMA